jgi:phosphoribosylformimino-5-aminoimidazole carboxamide ribotide isomerase
VERPLFSFNRVDKMRFRPCIDLHEGKVKQIVGSTLTDDDPGRLQTNFTADAAPAWFAELYRKDGLQGGHVIMLGPGNEDAAAEALSAWPGGLQVGGGITALNAQGWLERGASHVIVTSWVFREGRIDLDRLALLVSEIGKERLVLDLSCRKQGDDYLIVTDRWQKFTEVTISSDTLMELADYCDEFLIHAADVEGTCSGIEEELIGTLADYSPIPTTYAGGVSTMADLDLIARLGGGKIDVTVGSALDIFGGELIKYSEVVKMHNTLKDLT